MAEDSDIWEKKYNMALVQAALVFVVLFSGVIALTWWFDFSKVDMGGLLFLAASLCCVFIAKNIYDIARSNILTERLKHQVSVDQAIASEELYIKLYENSPVAYMIVDEKTEVKSANLASFRLFGIKNSNFLGLRVFDHVSCEDQDHQDMIVSKFHSGVSVSDETVLIKREDGREVWALLSLFVYKNVMQERIGLLTLVDITRQKKAEDAKTEFVSLASHQLRTPLAGMKWSAELLQIDGAENFTERQHRYIERLLISINRMSVLIDDFLRVSRFELGTFQAEYQSISVREIIEDIISEQAQAAAKKRIEVNTFFDKNVDKIVSDPNLLRMIIGNLFSNAVKYTRESGTVHVGYVRKEDQLHFTIADNGMGIPLEDQDQIFSKLFRASNAVRDVPDGTGLGLYILREAVHVLRGNVSFTTTENVGTTFEVVLPYESVDGK
jgi:PAS domain S-box-containing protein